MYQETYEDYIRSILGYPNYTYQNQTLDCNPMNNEQNEVLEAGYPEIYKVVYPMICKACNTNTRPVTPSLIEELTNEIYVSIESDNEINVNINLTNEIGNTTNNRSTTTNKTNTSKPENVRETRGEDRQFRNRGLQDLIRILLIRELLGRPGHPGYRPPMPPHGRPLVRPPFPPHGGPGQGPRPPIMPRDLYEM